VVAGQSLPAAPTSPQAALTSTPDPPHRSPPPPAPQRTVAVDWVHARDTVGAVEEALATAMPPIAALDAVVPAFDFRDYELLRYGVGAFFSEHADRYGRLKYDGSRSYLRVPVCSARGATGVPPLAHTCAATLWASTLVTCPHKVPPPCFHAEHTVSHHSPLDPLNPPCPLHRPAPATSPFPPGHPTERLRGPRKTHLRLRLHTACMQGPG
jgi:hypothetical protein